MLALATGWTEQIIAGEGPAGITDDFRRACHHALYARALARDLSEADQVATQAEAIDLTTIPTAGRSEVRKLREVATTRRGLLRALMGLDEADDG